MRPILVRRYNGRVIVLFPEEPGDLVGDHSAEECLAFIGRQKISVRPEEVMADSESVSDEEAQVVLGIYSMSGIDDLELTDHLAGESPLRRRERRRAVLDKARHEGLIHTDPEDPEDRIPIRGEPKRFVPLNLTPAAIDTALCRRVATEACRANPDLVRALFYFRDAKEREGFPVARAQDPDNWAALTEERVGSFIIHSFTCSPFGGQVRSNVYQKEDRIVGVELLSA